jgi:transposase
MTSYNNFIGIDIGKFNFVVASYDGKTTNEYQNSVSGIKLFLKEYKDKFKHSLCILETTGGYEVKLLNTLCMKKFAVHRANTRKVKSFISSHGNNAKTDSLDAKALAKYGFERYKLLELYIPTAKILANLYQLSCRRRELKQMLVAEKNRLQAPNSDLIKDSCKAHIDYLATQISYVSEEISKIIAKDPKLEAKKEVLKSIPGIGEITAADLLVLMPELGNMSSKQVASLAGVAPRANDSGKYKGYRSVASGREIVKPTLFLAAMAARKSNSDLKSFYENLIARGKKKMVALTALMRKIIVRANAKLRDFDLSLEKEGKITA